MLNCKIAMDDGYKEYRRNKPQQKLYKPGSGPLRRSSYGLDKTMDNFGIDNDPRGRDRNHYGSHSSVNEMDGGVGQREMAVSGRQRKPEQQLYVPRSAEIGADTDRHAKTSMRSDNSSQYINRRISNKQDKHAFNSGTGSYNRGASRRDFPYKDGANNDINYNNRNYRQMSETRSTTPTHCVPDQTAADRNRDSKSMETSAGRHVSGGGGKPPSGRRNSAGYPEAGRPKYMVNLDNIPPRFRKKFLEHSGHHSFDSVDQVNRDRSYPNYSVQQNYNQNQFHNANTNWSQTLPSRGRGRLHDNDVFDREKFMTTFLKNYEVHNSRRSTPSNSYINLYEPNAVDNRNIYENTDSCASYSDSPKEHNVSKNGISDTASEATYSQKDNQRHETDNEQDSETISQISSNIIDMTLDWTEEVEKNIKLDDMCDSSTSFSQNLKPNIPAPQDVKPPEPRESDRTKRSGRSKRRDKRSSSRGHKNSENKTEKTRKDSNVSISEPERNRKDSNVSLQHEAVTTSLKQRDRERRDSHRSNRSSNLGNSRDDLDRWRSLRSYSREQSTEGRIVSQCNSRDTSANRAMSPRDNDGFRVPVSAPKSGTWINSQKNNNGSWSGRTPSIERGRHSPAPSIVSTGGDGGGASSGAREGREGRSRRSRRRNSRRKQGDIAPAAPHPPGAVPAPTNINWREEILQESKKTHTHDKHHENTHQRNRLNSVMSDKSVTESSVSQPGILILPQSSVSHIIQKDQTRGGSTETQRILYDHHNPSKPIIVQTSPTKIDIRMERGVRETASRGGAGYEAGDAARAARHRALLQEVDRADAILQTHTLRGPLALADHWNDVIETRKSLQTALQRLLMSDLKYCQADNIEHHFWKILYYNFIEILRKSFSQISPEDKPKIVKLINVIIEEGNGFFENLVQMLEKAYKFNTEDYINDSHMMPPKGLGYVGLALISVQKLYVFLGDLARYKEQVNETNNYSKSKFWYTKAQQINPKNGRPYNQLAILAIYARRKLDAVYYYMRSLMSSNPFHSARESLLSLFDENRKKYEAAERKRRAALESGKDVTGENGSGGAESSEGQGQGQGLRREVWVRPSGHRTTTLRPDPRDEHLANMTPVELNKTFITSYLHVHGKLITKIGMETFHESAGQMLRQFRALLYRQPLPTPAARLLQLTALNMFAVESTASGHKDGSSGGGTRSAWLECALGVSLLMFGAMLERCCALLPEPPHTQQYSDALLLLPAIKAWSDWMLCHSSVWNPPPTFDNFEIENENDPWDWLAKLMNILEEHDDKTIQLENEPKEGWTCVRLSEDASLSGFTPLMYMEPAAAWSAPDPAAPPHQAEHALRMRKLLFFGTEYLVGVEPPVLKLEYPTNAPPRYISAVQRAPQNSQPLQHLENVNVDDVRTALLQSEDSADESGGGAASGPASLGEGDAGATDEATRKLLRRKEQLESRKATLDKRRQRMQEILRGGWVSVEVEVRPRWLVPDTNCFIDHLSLLRAVVAMPRQPYLLAVPLVVMSELEGLRKCARVGKAAAAALSWIDGSGSGGVKLATSLGSLLASRSFTAESDASSNAGGTRATNDDRVLATALNLHANLASEPDKREEGGDSQCVRRVREVVLLTDDRNLRVKALAAELPARDLPSFVHWAGIDTNAQAGTDDSSSRLK